MILIGTFARILHLDPLLRLLEKDVFNSALKLLLVLIALNTSLLSIQVSVERASGFSSDSSKGC